MGAYQAMVVTLSKAFALQRLKTTLQFFHSTTSRTSVKQFSTWLGGHADMLRLRWRHSHPHHRLLHRLATREGFAWTGMGASKADPEIQRTLAQGLQHPLFVAVCASCSWHKSRGSIHRFGLYSWPLLGLGRASQHKLLCACLERDLGRALRDPVSSRSKYPAH